MFVVRLRSANISAIPDTLMEAIERDMADGVSQRNATQQRPTKSSMCIYVDFAIFQG